MISKLIDKIQKTNAPIVVGLDPMLNYIPEHITKAAFAQYGETLEGAAEAVWQYNKAIVDATYAGQVLCAQAWKPSSQHAGEKRGVPNMRMRGIESKNCPLSLIHP